MENFDVRKKYQIMRQKMLEGKKTWKKIDTDRKSWKEMENILGWKPEKIWEDPGRNQYLRCQFLPGFPKSGPITWKNFMCE